MPKLRRAVLSVVLVAALSGAVLTAAVAVDTVTRTEPHAAAQEMPWSPTWNCIAGIGFASTGFIWSMVNPPPGEAWYYIWFGAKAAYDAYGAFMTAWNCSWALAREHPERAQCLRSPSYGLGTTYVYGVPIGTWWSRGPCGDLRGAP